MYACDNCGKTVSRGNQVSHAKNRVKTIRKPNLKYFRVLIKGQVVRMRLCMKCARMADRPHKVAKKNDPVVQAA